MYFYIRVSMEAFTGGLKSDRNTVGYEVVGYTPERKNLIGFTVFVNALSLSPPVLSTKPTP